MPKKNNRPAQGNRNGHPARVPLLSNIRPDDVGLAQGAQGRFSPTHQGDGNQALQNINYIVANLDGKPNERGSIPDARAQEICFAYMLEHLTPLNAGDDIHREWRGALCAYILSPLLLFAAQPLPWEPGGAAERPLPLYWEHVKARELEAEQTLLGEALWDTVDPLPDENGREWRFLVMRQSTGDYPVLSFDARLLAVPSASLADMETLAPVFPWLNKASFFTDPLEALDPDTLRYIDRWIGVWLAQDPSPMSQQARGALTLLQTDVRARVNDLADSEPFAEVWELVMQALLLRDLVDTGVTVFRLEDRAGEAAFQEAMHKAPRDAAAMRTWREITDQYTYGVQLGDRFAGFLDTEQALWLPAPGYLRDTKAYRDAAGALAAALKEPPLYAAYQYRLQIVLAFFTQIRTSLIAALGPRQTAGMNAAPLVFSPGRSETAPDDVALLKHPFAVMSRICGCHTGNTGIFTPGIFLFKDIAGPLVSSPAYRAWHVVNVAETDSASARNAEPAGAYKALLPLTACGATIIRNCEALRYAPCVTLTRDAPLKTVTASLRIELGSVTYEWTTQYRQEAIQEGDLNDLPAVGFWPDAAAGAGELPWHLYYTYVNFHEDQDAKRYMAQVYDADGLCMTPSSAGPVTLDTKDMHYAWQTQASPRQPSFCLLMRNGLSIGCLLMEKPRLFTAVTRDAVLAVDFGTTFTTGAVMLTPGNPTAPVFQNSVIHWMMNEKQGITWSLEQFIADRFNCLTATGGAEPFFSAVARFTADWNDGDANANVRYGNELFADGHIYYFGNSIHDDNLMGNPRYFSLKLKDINNPHDINGSNATLFLKQVLETYLLYCRLQGVSVSEIRFAYPLAFDLARQEHFRRNIEALVALVAPRAGMPACKTSFTSESQAVCAYFCSQPGILRGVAIQGIITLDIGGGTADYSYYRTNPGQTICHCYSNFLAGHMLLGAYPYRCRQQKEAGNESALNWFFDGCNELSANGNLTGEEKDNLKTLADSLASGHARNREYFIFCIERFVSLNAPLYGKLLQSDAFGEQYTLLLFELTLLLWLGYLLGTQKWASVKRRPVCIHMGGNGAHLFHMLKQGDKDKLCRLVPPGDGVPLETNINRCRKREVAEGLLQESDLLSEDIVATQADCDQTVQELWEAFAALCSRFLDAFPERDDEAARFLRSLGGNNRERLKDRFILNVSSFTDLFRFMPEFCDMMIEEII